MQAVLTDLSLEWLQDHRIFLHRRGDRRLRAGDALSFAESCEVEPYTGFFAGRQLCTLGAMSFSNSPVPVKLKVGRYCSIAHGVDAHFVRHPVEHVSTSLFTHEPDSVMTRTFAADQGAEAPAGFPNPSRPPPVIQHDVWIGAHASLLPGVTISVGAVVAANSVVTRSVGAYEIVGGNPARVIRKRFPDEVVARLLASEWWLYRFTDLNGLRLDDPARFLEGFEARKPDLEPYRPQAARLAEMPVRA